MNKFKKGPEIKLPELKVPDFLLDLYYDLRERHLLPLVAVLAIAIVAVPILLSQSSGSDTPEESGATESAIAAQSAVGANSRVLVTKSAPGLRDLDRRLRRLHAKDPFRPAPQEAEESSSGTAGESEAAPGESSGSSTETATESPAPSSTTPSEGGAEPTSGPGNITYFSYAIDVRVVTGSSQAGGSGDSSGNSTVRRNLPELTMLPSRDTPAAVYMGSTKDGKKALMLISSDVQAIFGDGKCVLGSDSCELLAMEPGVPETFVYGGAGRTFKIELQKIHLVTTDKLNRAPLGKPKQQGKPKKGGQGQFRQQ
jgi:hypothetical protein